MVPQSILKRFKSYVYIVFINKSYLIIFLYIPSNRYNSVIECQLPHGRSLAPFLDKSYAACLRFVPRYEPAYRQNPNTTQIRSTLQGGYATHHMDFSKLFFISQEVLCGSPSQKSLFIF